MPMTRPVFNTSENSCDINAVLNKVLYLVQNVDSHLDTLRADQELLKERLNTQEEQLAEIAKYVRGVDSRLQAVTTHCEVIRRESADTNNKVKTLDEKLEDVRADCRALRTISEKNTNKVTSAGDKADVPKAITPTAVPHKKKAPRYARKTRNFVVGCMTPECAKQHNPRTQQLVQAFINSRDWETLKRDLGAVLDHSSLVYIQLLEAGSLCGVGHNGFIQLASLLLCAGLPVDTVDNYGDNILLGAAQGGHVLLVKLLLDRGASINVKGHYDYTPLMRAAQNGHLQVVQCLVQAGADTTVRNKSGVTVLYLAKSRGQTLVEQYLEQLPH